MDPAGFEGLAALLALPALATTAPLWHAATVEAQGERPELAALLREAFIREASDNLPAPLQAQHRAILIALLALARDCAEAFQLTTPRVRLAWLQVADRRATAHLALVLEDWPVGEVLEPAVLPPRHAQGGAAGAAAQPQAPPAFAPGRAHVEFRQLGIDCLCASAASAEAYYRLLLHAENRRLLGGIGTETEQLVSEKAQWAREWQAHLRAASALASAEPSAEEVQAQRQAELRAHPQLPPSRFYAAARHQALTRARLARVRALVGARRLLPDAWPQAQRQQEQQRRCALPGDDNSPPERAAAVLLLRDEYRLRGLHPKTADEQAEWGVILHHPDSPELEHYL